MCLRSDLSVYTFDPTTYDCGSNLFKHSDLCQDIAILYNIWTSFKGQFSFVVNSSKLSTVIAFPDMESSRFFIVETRYSSNDEIGDLQSHLRCGKSLLPAENDRNSRDGKNSEISSKCPPFR